MITIKNNVEIAHEVLNGLWGNGEERKEKLTNAGYDYNAVQSIVNALVYDKPIEEPLVENPVQNVDNVNSERLLTVEFDKSKYDGLEIIIIGGE